MKKLKFLLIIVLVIAAAIAAQVIYMRFIKTYTVGKDPKLTEIRRLYYISGMQSLDYGYIYDSYNLVKRDNKYYAETDKFDKDKKEQIVTKVEITGPEFKEILQLIEGCDYVRHKASDPDRMDGDIDNQSFSADIYWDKEPDGAWDLILDEATRGNLVTAIDNAVKTIGIVFNNETVPSSVWIIRDTKENRGTSVWGTAMVQAEELGKEYTVLIPLSQDYKYLFRMIDENQIYYEADIPKLKEGWKVSISNGSDNFDARLQIYDEKGKLVSESTVFSAAL